MYFTNYFIGIIFNIIQIITFWSYNRVIVLSKKLIKLQDRNNSDSQKIYNDSHPLTPLNKTLSESNADVKIKIKELKFSQSDKHIKKTVELVKKRSYRKRYGTRQIDI